MKKITSFILLILVLSSLVLTSASCSFFAGFGQKKNETNHTDTKNDILESTAESYVSIDINPEITLTLDEDGTVLTVVAENEDAQVMLWNEEALVGLDIETAIAKITSLAAKYGYISENNKEVSVIANGCKSREALEELVSKISAKITVTAQESGMNVSVDTEGAYSLLRKYEAFITEHPELASSVSVSKFKLALAAHENGDITLAGAVQLDDSELIKRVSIAHSEIKAYYTETYEKLHKEAMKIYEMALETEIEKVYAEYLIKHAQIFDAKILYAYVYQMYAIASRGIFAAAETIDYFDTARNYVLDEERVSDILVALGLNEDESEKLQDSNGRITLDSVLAYTDIYMKNLGEDVDVDAVKAAIDASIANAETDVIAEANRLAQEYKPTIIAMIDSSKAVKAVYDGVLDTVSPLLPDSIKQVFSSLIADYDKALLTLDQILSDDEIDTDDLREVAIDLKDTADETLGKLEALLSDEALAEIESEKQAKRDKLSSQKEQFENTIADAKRDAEERLAALKAARS